MNVFDDEMDEELRVRARHAPKKCCANCVEVKPDVVTLPDWPAGTGPCDLCLQCICLLFEHVKQQSSGDQGIREHLADNRFLRGIVHAHEYGGGQTVCARIHSTDNQQED